MFLKITEKGTPRYSMIEISKFSNNPIKVTSKEALEKIRAYAADTNFGELPKEFTKPFWVVELDVIEVHSKKENKILMCDTHEGYIVADNSKTIEAIRLN